MRLRPNEFCPIHKSVSFKSLYLKRPYTAS